MQFTNLEEVEEAARLVLPKQVFDYYAGGAESETTLRDNRAAFSRYRLLPRVLVDVSEIDTSCELLGCGVKVPILVAPMSKHKMAHPEGELATVRAAAAEGFGMGVSTLSTYSLEEVAAAGQAANIPSLWFQLYVNVDRSFTRDLIARAEAAGYQALAVTVDAPVLGRREADLRNKFQMPEGIRYVNLDALQEKRRREGQPLLGVYGAEPGGAKVQAAHSTVDSSLTWPFLTWLRSVTRLPILLKGVLAPADAELALAAGVDGIIVSNHGGRQLDHVPAPVDMLPAICRVVNRRVPVLMDGGVRRGTDVFKALALGADAVMLGRPVLFGLALGGEGGARRVLATLRSELEVALALAGCPCLRDITRRHVIAPGDDLSKL